MLVDGGTGTGKTRATNKLTEALELLHIKPAYTGSTGTAVTNYVGGHTLHGMMSFGRDLEESDSFQKKFQSAKTRREVMERLGDANSSNVVLVIDEISALPYSI